MRARAIIGVVCPAFLLCGAALAEEPAAAAPPPVPPATGLLAPVPRAESPVASFIAPQNPFDLLYRHFAVTGELNTKVAALRQEWNADTAADMDRVEQEIDAKYAAELVATFDDKQKADFTRISTAIKTYQAAAGKADRDYTEALAAAGVRVQSQWLPDDPIRLLAVLPRAAGQPFAYIQLISQYDSALARERAKVGPGAPVDRAADAKTPPAGAGPKSEAEAVAKVRAEFVEKARTALKGMPQEKAYNDLVAALDRWTARKQAARATLAKELPGATAAQYANLPPGPQVDDTLVPRRTTEIMVRFLSPTPDQDAKLRAIRVGWENDQQRLRAEYAARLDARYAERIAGLLNEPPRESFKRASAAVNTYRVSRAQAETAYRAAWAGAGFGAFRPRTDGVSLAHSVPGMTREQRQALDALRKEYNAELNRIRSLFYEGRADEQQAPRSRAEFDALTHQADAGHTAKVRAMLGDTPQGKAYQTVNDARLACAAQEKALLEKLFADLKPLVGEDRLAPPSQTPPARSTRLVAPPATSGSTATQPTAPKAK